MKRTITLLLLTLEVMFGVSFETTYASNNNRTPVSELESGQQYTVSVSVVGESYLDYGSFSVVFYDENDNVIQSDEPNTIICDEGSDINIVLEGPIGSYYMKEIVVNGTSLGVNEESNYQYPLDFGYSIENLSGDMEIIFKPELYIRYKTVYCSANGPGSVKMYKNGTYVGTTTDNGTGNKVVSVVIDHSAQDEIMLEFIPDDGCTFSELHRGYYDGDFEQDGSEITNAVNNNTYTIKYQTDEYSYSRVFGATFERVTTPPVQQYTVTVSIDDVTYNTPVEDESLSVVFYDNNNNAIPSGDSHSITYEAGSYIKIGLEGEGYYIANYYVSDIIVNGTSFGPYEELNGLRSFVIDNLSGNLNVAFKLQLLERYRTVYCSANGPGSVKMYKNGTYIGTTTENGYGFKVVSVVIDHNAKDEIKLEFIPDECCIFTKLESGFYEPEFGDGGEVEVENNMITVKYVDDDTYLGRRCFAAYFERIEESVILNETNFPDATFRTYISDLSGLAEGGTLTNEKLLSVTSIDVHNKGITSLQGIEHFTSLTELVCCANELTSLDVSNNTALTFLDCGDNKLTSLDVSNNTALTSLLCGYNQLTSLDVSHNTKLTTLECNNNNQLTSLDVSNNTALTRLLCAYNQHTNLNVSNNTVLAWLGSHDDLVATSTGSNLYSISVPSGFDISKVSEFKVNNVSVTPIVVDERLIFKASSTCKITYKYDVSNSVAGLMEVTVYITALEEPNYDNTIYMDNVEVLSGTEAVLSVKMKNTVVAEGFEFNLYLPEGITVVTDEDGLPDVTLSTERTNSRKTNSFDAVLREDGSLRVLGASTNGSTISGNDGEIVQVKVAIADDMEEGDYIACVKDIAISDENSVSYTSAMTTSSIKVNAYIVGDANKDRAVDVADFIAVAHHLLENTPASFHPKAADANQDEKLDVADLTAIAHLILYGTISKPTNESPAKQFMPLVVGSTNESTEENYLYIEPVSVRGNSQVSLSVKMRNAVEAEGFGFDLYLPDGMSFATDADGFAEASLSTERTNSNKTNSFDAVIRPDGSLRVLAASTNGSSISGNDGEVALVTVNVASGMEAGEYPLIMKEIAISDVDAVSHRTDLQESSITILINGITTNINGIDNEDDNAEWYTLDGRRLNGKPKAKGVYIMNGKKVGIK